MASSRGLSVVSNTVPTAAKATEWALPIYPPPTTPIPISAMILPAFALQRPAKRVASPPT